MRTTVRTLFVAIAAIAVVWIGACGSSASNSTPAPSPIGGGGGGSTVTITITGMNGNQSFSPDPATVQSGQAVVWVNNDTTTHRIVQDAGAFDTGSIAPGGSSAPIVLSSTAAMPYHCSIHPSMVGTINGAAAAGGGGSGY